MSGDRPGGSPFTRPRIAIATGLAILLAILLVIDARDTSYTMSDLTLSVLLGSILTLLGIEINDLLRGGRP